MSNLPIICVLLTTLLMTIVHARSLTPSRTSPSSLFHLTPIPYPTLPSSPSSSSFSPPFASPSPSSSLFNDSLSQYLLLLSSAAYSSSPSLCLLSHPSSLHFTVTHTFTTSPFYSSTLYGYAGVDSSPSSPSLTFAFQGSMTPSQLYEELRHDNPMPASNSSASPLLANAYFYDGALLLLPNVTTAYRSLTARYPTYPVYFTGHSLGAALATMLAFLLLTSPLPTPSSSSPLPLPLAPVLYTFGEPRLGNHALSLLLTSTLPAHFRVVHWRDVVPHLPPCPTTTDPVTHASVCAVTNGTKGYYGYHSQVEVFYSSVMPSLGGGKGGGGGGGGPGVKWEECWGEPLGEDQACSNQFDYWSVDDHEVYYQVDVGTFCLTPPELLASKEEEAAAAATFRTPLPRVAVSQYR